MPELPEVETIVRGLQKTVIGQTVTGFWCERPETIKTHSIEDFAQNIQGSQISGARRRAKYILMDLSNDHTIAIHQKMSGHLLHGKWQQDGETKTWTPLLEDLTYHDPFNRFIRAIFFLGDGSMIGLSDVRRFAKMYLAPTDTLETIHDFPKLGPEPLDPKLTFETFYDCFKKRKGLIKKVMMDPYVIVGIGNIYADEILWHSDIHPMSRVENLAPDQFRRMYENTCMVLERAIEAKGHSEMNYRMLDGNKGSYQTISCAYQHDGEACQKKDGGILEKIWINSRSAHFCPVHQKLAS